MPPFITPAAAEGFLFAGKVVQLLQKAAAGQTEQQPRSTATGSEHSAGSSLVALRGEVEGALVVRSCFCNIPVRGGDASVPACTHGMRVEASRCRV